MMPDDIVIEIFGTPTSAEAFAKVLAVAAHEGASLDWIDREDDACGSEFVEAAMQAADDGDMLRFMRTETASTFEETREACKEAELCYLFSTGTGGGEEYETVTYWHPGLKIENTPTLDGLNPVLSLKEVRDAAQQGIEFVSAMLARYENMTLANVPKVLFLSDDIRSELKENLPTP